MTSPTLFDEPQVLVPFHRSEVLTVGEAASIAGKSPRTVREWCLRLQLGRHVGDGQWNVSKVALAMHLDGNKPALKAYLAGDRSSPAIIAYFERCGVKLSSYRELLLSKSGGDGSGKRSYVC